MSLFAVLDDKIVNFINLRGNNLMRLDDYPITIGMHVRKECIMYDEIEQLILKNIFPKIKFCNHYDLDVLKQRYYRSNEPERIWKGRLQSPYN